MCLCVLFCIDFVQGQMLFLNDNGLYLYLIFIFLNGCVIVDLVYCMQVEQVMVFELLFQWQCYQWWDCCQQCQGIGLLWLVQVYCCKQCYCYIDEEGYVVQWFEYFYQCYVGYWVVFYLYVEEQVGLGYGFDESDRGEQVFVWVYGGMLGYMGFWQWGIKCE